MSIPGPSETLTLDSLRSLGILGGGKTMAANDVTMGSSAPAEQLAAPMSKKAEKKAAKADKKGGGAKKQVIDLAPPSGTRDFFPEEMRAEQWLFDKFSATSRRFGFEKYDAPVLENVALYERKAGEEITEQMYNFVDKEDNRVTLRPEMTPSLARMVLNLMREETGQMAALLPLKWYSIPQCWRFETTQRGRKREHYQWNMDMIGVENVTAEAELLASVVDFFESVGLTAKDIKIKVNSRKVLQKVLKEAGVKDEDFAAATVIIDKQDKIGADECKKQLVEMIGMPAATASTVVDATAAPDLKTFAEKAGAADSDEVKELQELFDLAKAYGYGDWLVFDASVVRGLAYYTGIVFEANDRAGEFRAICGGGRYDELLTKYGAKQKIPMCGYGFGDCVIMELLKEKKLLPSFTSEVDYLVCAFSKDMLGPSMSVAKELRKGGKKVVFYQQVAKKIGNAFNYADRIGAARVALVAPDEWNNGMIRIKDLRNEDPAVRKAVDAATDEAEKEKLMKDIRIQKDVPFAKLPVADDFF